VADDDLAFLSSFSEHPNRPGDVSNLNPDFASRLANALRQARAAGLPLGVMSGYRSDTTTGSAYDAGGNSSHGYGLASDISGLDGPNGKITQQWAQIAEANGLHNPYGVDNKAEFNHWQLPPQPLEQTPKLLASLKAARATGDWPSVWSAYNSGGGPSRPGTPAPSQTTMFAGLNPDARGMRNNNPGNLVANEWTASLPGYKGSDGKFAIFDTPQHGALALDQNLAHYGTKGIDTPLAVASTWAPAGDNNNPQSYGGQIAKALGVGLNDKININDPAVRGKIAQAIALVENGPGKSTGFAVNGPPAAGAAAPPGTTLSGIAAGALPGFPDKATSDNFMQSAKALDKAWHGDQSPGEDAGQAAAFNFLPARNVSPLIPPAGSGYVSPQTYGTTLAGMMTPMQWGGQSPGQAPYANVGGAPVGQQFGTQLGSMQQLQQMMAMMGSPYGDMGNG
jgi:hypothetical protein